MRKYIFLIFFLPLFSFGAITDGLVSYWPFDESSGNATDVHGANDVTNVNSIAYATGILNNSADLEASNSNYFYTGDTADLSITGDLTIVGWINKESDTNVGNILTKRTGTGNQRSYGFYAYTDLLGLDLSDDGNALTTGQVSTTLTNGTWYQVGMVYDASAGEVTFYKNGTQTGATQGSMDTSIFNSTSDLCIGCLFSPAQDFFDGKIDELGIWNRTLTAEEISELYNSGTPLAYPFVTAGIYGCMTVGNINYNENATIDDGSCYITATTTIETIATTTNFGLAIIIGLISLGFIGFIGNSLTNKKKKWQK